MELPPLPTSGVLIGQTKSGKSHLMNRLLTEPGFYAGQYDILVIFSPTQELSGDFGDLKEGVHFNGTPVKKPKIYKFRKYRPQVLKQIRNDQRRIIKKEGHDEAPQVLVVLDDVMDNPSAMHGKQIEKLFFSGRHVNMSPFLLVQRLRTVSPTIRSNTNMTFFFRSANRLELEKFSEEHGSRKNVKSVMQQLDSYYDEPYAFVYVDSRAPLTQKLRKGFTDQFIEITY